MRKLVGILLLLLCVGRLVAWKEQRAQSLDLCDALLSLNRVQRLSKSTGIAVRGSYLPSEDNKIQLSDAEVEIGNRFYPFLGRVVLYSVNQQNPLLFGRKIVVWGSGHCALIHRNPGRVEDGLIPFAMPLLHVSVRSKKIVLASQRASLLSRLCVAFENWLADRFRGFPSLLGFERAVWTGTLSTLPPFLVDLYREGGLLSVLAMSGQHVAGMVLLLSFLFRISLFRIFRRYSLSVWYAKALATLPLLGAGVLYVTSEGSPPMERTFAMTGAFLILRMRRLHVTRLQLAFSTIACLLLWNPERLTSEGFFLSAVSTVLFFEILSKVNLREQLRAYVVMTGLMPILILPLTAFFFSKVALVSPFGHLFFAWIWDMFLIPVGFALPFIVWILPSALRIGFLGQLERGWGWLVAIHHPALSLTQAGYQSVVRPTLFEFALLEILLLFLFSAWLDRSMPPVP